MILNEENMKKYLQIEREINRINRKIDFYNKNPVNATHGVVKGSMGGFPYAQCHFVVSAPDVKSDRERHIKVQNLLIQLAEKKEEYKRFQLDIDMEIENIEDLEMRQIFEYKYVNRLSDKDIGELMGYDRSTISKKIDRFFESNLLTV